MIYRHTLSNGLRVMIEEIAYVRSVSMGIWVGTGSRDELPAEAGVSHLLEHMFFKGTSKLSATQLAEVFDNIGGQINAFTTKEYTGFHAKVLDEHAPLALETLAQMMFDSVFDEEELHREKRVVVEEIKMYEDNPEEAVHDLIVEESYAGHPLGGNILGTEESLARIDRSCLLNYVNRRYTPDNMVLSISGHIQKDAVLDHIERLFGGFRRKKGVVITGAPTFLAKRIFRPRPVEQTHVCLAVRGHEYEDERSYALVLLNNVLGGSSSSRLFQEIRERRGMAYNIFSYHSMFRDAGLFTIYFGSSAAQAEEVYTLLESLLRDMAKNGITTDELTKAKNQLVGSLLLSMESTSQRMSRLGKNELLLGRQVDLEETIAELRKVTLQDVHTLAIELLLQPISVVAMGPEDQPFDVDCAFHA